MHFILGQPITVESIGLTLENLPVKDDDKYRDGTSQYKTKARAIIRRNSVVHKFTLRSTSHTIPILSSMLLIPSL